MGLQSYSLRGYTADGHADLKKALAVTKELGLHYWESYPAHVPMTDDREKIKAMQGRDRGRGRASSSGYGVVHLGKDEAAEPQDLRVRQGHGPRLPLGRPRPGQLRPPRQAGRGVRHCRSASTTTGPATVSPRSTPSPRRSRTTARRSAAASTPAISSARGKTRSAPSRSSASADLRRPPQGRQGRQDVHDPRPGRPAHRRPAQGPGREQVHYCLAIEYEEKPEDPFDDIKACLAAGRKAISASARPEDRPSRTSEQGRAAWG